MMSREADQHNSGTTRSSVVMTGLLAVGMFVAACGESAPPPSPPPPPPPPPPADPADALFDLDPGVQFPQENLPGTLEAAEAIVAFANAFGAGERDAVLRMLTPASRADLQALIPPREWADQFEHVEAIRICIVEDLGSTVRVGIGVQEPDGAYLLGWRALRNGDEWSWQAVPVRDIEAPSVAMLDNDFLPAPRAEGDTGASLNAPDGAGDSDDGNDNGNGLQNAPGNTTIPSGRPGR